jgi:biopolymer transport protein ExbD
MSMKRDKQVEDMDINITPMLDIVFIMLIFFIVTTSFVKETGIAPKRPVAETATAQTQANILIGVDANGSIYINRHQVRLSDVRPLVESAVNENPESSAILITDEAAPAGVMLDIMDQVRLGGVSNIAVAADPESI